MFRPLAIAATLLPVLFHSIFGCCWHHAHGMNHNASTPVAVEKGHCSGHDHAGGISHGSSDDRCCAAGESDVPCCPDEHRQPCNEQPCVYALSQSIRPECPEVSLIHHVAFIELHRPVVVLAESDVIMALLSNAPARFSSPRALTQVWIV